MAQVCLGYMNDARGVSILRTLSSESQMEVKLAALAVHMGMLVIKTLLLAGFRFPQSPKYLFC